MSRAHPTGTGPTPIWIAGEQTVPEIVSRCCAAAGKPDGATTDVGPRGEIADDLAEWVVD